MPPNEKLSAQLKNTVESTPESNDMDVVVELTESDQRLPLNSAERMNTLRQSFGEQAKSIRGAIQRLGGEITHEAWINSTIAARLPLKALDELSRETCVRRIDVPRKLERE